MGCSSSRIVPESISTCSMESPDTPDFQYEVYEETGSPEIENPRVHWDDKEEEDDDYLTEYNMDMSRSYSFRAMSSKGPRSAGGRSMLTTTTGGETFEGSEYFDM